MITPLLTVDELAEVLRRSPRWVYEQTRLKRFPHTRVGRTVRYSEDQVQEILAAGEVGVLIEPVQDDGISSRSLAARRAS